MKSESSKPTIFIVDENILNAREMISRLQDKANFILATNSSQALKMLEEKKDLTLNGVILGSRYSENMAEKIVSHENDLKVVPKIREIHGKIPILFQRNDNISTDFKWDGSEGKTKEDLEHAQHFIETFTVVAKGSDNQAKEKNAVGSAKSENGLKKPRILVAMPNEIAGNIILKTLNDSDITLVKSIAEAKTLLSNTEYKGFDAVITQYFAGRRETGVDLIKDIRIHSKMPIFLTTASGKLIIQDALAAGATIAQADLDGTLDFTKNVTRKINAAKILLVEDNVPQEKDHYSNILEQIGNRYINVKFERAQNAEEAKKIMNGETFDAVVFTGDIAQPGKRSELLDAIQLKNKNTKIIAITNPDYKHGEKEDGRKREFEKKVQESGGTVVSVHKFPEIQKEFQKIAATKEGFAPGFSKTPYSGIQ